MQSMSTMEIHNETDQIKGIFSANDIREKTECIHVTSYLCQSECYAKQNVTDTNIFSLLGQASSLEDSIQDLIESELQGLEFRDLPDQLNLSE